MSLTVPIALFGWPLVVVGMFAFMRPRRAVIAAFLGAWLFLPMTGFTFLGWPDYGKMTATAYGTLLGVLLFDWGRLAQFRPGWMDLPMLVWCVVPMASSLSNGLGVYDGFSQTFGQTITWGVPWFLGRLYFGDLAGLRELAVGIFIGGVIYVPLCLFELRMSPRLHLIVYGYHQHSWTQHLRGDGYRPKVFMQHGLAVGLWMAIAGMVGAWLWQSGALRRLWGVPTAWLVAAVVGTAVLCRSFGALVLLVLGLGVLVVLKKWNLKLAVLCLIAGPMLYMGARATDVWDGSHLVRAVEMITSPERVGSLQYRIDAERILADHALRQPLFGWGTWSRNRPARMGEDDPDMATDGLWVLALGQRGVVGLAALVGAILLPAVFVYRRLPPAAWTEPLTAPAAALAVVLGLFMVDSLFNAMPNPTFLLAAGGLIGAFAPGSGLLVRPELVRHQQNAAGSRWKPAAGAAWSGGQPPRSA